MIWDYHLSIVDAAPFREVLYEVTRIHTLTFVAQHCGLARYTLTRIRNGDTDRIRQSTAYKLNRMCVLLPSESDVA